MIKKVKRWEQAGSSSNKSIKNLFLKLGLGGYVQGSIYTQAKGYRLTVPFLLCS
jgi:hypothetical protein